MSAPQAVAVPKPLPKTGAPPALRLSEASTYPERPARRRRPVEDRLREFLAWLPVAPAWWTQRRLARVATVAAAEQGWAANHRPAPAEAAAVLGAELRRHGFTAPLVGRTLALVREVADATLGMRPYDVQLMAAFALLQGRLAEMETGEGKTLSAALCAAIAALAGRRVHVITVNDYLARRDAEALEPFYAALGLTVGLVLTGQSAEERREIYGHPIVYTSNKELAFDYLRDQIARREAASPLHLKLGQLLRPARPGAERGAVMRGLVFAIVDEADSVLIDEARTPLIISQTGTGDTGYAQALEALELVAQLAEGEHFMLDRTHRRIDLTEDGQRRMSALADLKGQSWGSTLLRAELVRKALTAQFLFDRDVHYLVRDGKVEIIDEYTGRIMPDRFWNDGLQQMIEAKEGVEPSRARNSVARITYQRFFTRYLHLCGMSGTVAEVARELRAVYGLGAARIPTHRPSRRRRHPSIIVPTAEEKWRIIAARAIALAAEGRPVLIGTRSVAESERASRLLAEAGTPHALLNASQDAHEAAIVAAAGEAGTITIATNMAGRGTDIRLGPGVAERGGLAVILSERHDAGRIDRQLAGRCARQGDAGSVEAILSFEDALLDPLRMTPLGRRLIALAGRRSRLSERIFDYAQRRAERQHYLVRRDLLRFDVHLAGALSFAGRPE